MNTPFNHEHTYKPTAQDADRLKEVIQVIGSLYENIQLGKVDSSTQEIIGGHFFDSMQYLIDEFFQEQYTLENLIKRPYLTLFEVAMLIGWLVNPDDPDCLLTDSSKLFSEAFLNGEISPRNPRNFLRYDDFHQVPRAGILAKVLSKSEKRPVQLGCINIEEVPDLFWLLNKKEVAEFAILKGCPEELLNNLLSEDTNGQRNLPVQPDYLDENHPMFSKELSIAIECWNKVLSENPNRPKRGSRKKLIKEWLEHNHKELTGEAKGRIAVMLNPDGHGGVTKSE